MSPEMVPVVIIFLILPNLLLSFVTAQGPVTTGRVAVKCLDNGNYTSNNSTYRTNLDVVLSALPINIDHYGFYNASAGEIPDRANAIALCRGDVDLDTCRECLRTAAVGVLNSCPNPKQVIIWYRLCMLRFSNETIFGTLANVPPVCLWNPDDPISPTQFQQDLTRLIRDVRGKAINGGSRMKIAAGNVSGSDFQTIFALAQCTPDLYREDCDDCFSHAVEDITKCCQLRRGCRIHRPSCNLRYETFRFFNETRLEELVPLQSIPAPSPKGTGDGNITRTVVKVVPPTILCAMIAVLVVILIRMRNKHKLKRQLESVDEIHAAESMQYTYSTIRVATNDFLEDNKLGEGGFGTVYKGVLPTGQEIAVKRLSDNSQQGSLEFMNEVLFLTQLLHRNLVRLLGFCLEGKEKLLVYEFVPNGSLDGFIFDPAKHLLLNWDRRFKIIIGVARGLIYLHEDSQLKIIHRDLKASNVLLDREMVPKIADFGMAKLFESGIAHQNTTRIVGTYGYMPPEYAIRGQLSTKVDVFSFGVLVLEIISGQKSTSIPNGDSTSIPNGDFAPNFLSFIWNNWRDGTYINIVNPFLRSSSSMSDIMRCIHISLLCVQQNPVDRPTMASVVLMLNRVSVTMAVPSKPAFYVGSGSGPNATSLRDNNSSRVCMPTQLDDELASRNEASMSEFYPR